jgi:molybdopterin-guanine dinucleotide biosynthesis protein B
MTKTAILGVYGESNIGKTTLITRIISFIKKEGKSIAIIKITDKSIGIDQQDKDTARYQQAGSALVVFSSTQETDFLGFHRLSLPDILSIISHFDLFDLILVEGIHDTKVPKIRLGDCTKRPNTVLEYKDNFDDVIETIRKLFSKQQKEECILTLHVNGKVIPLTEFPKTIILNTVLGLQKSLKGVKQISDVRIHIKK